MRLATVAISVLLVLVLPSAAGQARSVESSAAQTASVDGKEAKNKKQLARAVRKCRTIRKSARRKACVRKAKRRFANRPGGNKPVEPKPGTMYRVDVLDTYESDYFSPSDLQIKAGDSIEFIWSDLNQNPHNVSLVSGPAGIDRMDYATPNSPSRNYRWVRRFDKVGTWSFVCSLHHLMTLTVKVGK